MDSIAERDARNSVPPHVVAPLASSPVGSAIVPALPWDAMRRGSTYVFETPNAKRFTRKSHAHYWYQVRAAAGREDLEFYALRHFCATHLLHLGLSHADVAVQLGHTDGGALVMSTYGHPEAARARERLRARTR